MENNNSSPQNSVEVIDGAATVQRKTANYFSSVLQTKPHKRVMKIIELRNNDVVDGANVAMPMEAVEEVSSRFANTLYGYFIGKRLAFPLVDNYVKNTWAKYGLKRVQLHEDFFLFQFDSKVGWPIMLDSYTSNMCLSSWGRNTYTRALVEVSAKKELMESIVVAIPLSNGKGHTLAKLPKKTSPVDTTVEAIVDGFVELKKKKNKNKQPHHPKHIDGIRLGKPSLNVYYRQVDKDETSKSYENKDPSATDEWGHTSKTKEVSQINAQPMAINASDSEADKELILEGPNATRTTKTNDTGASTPADVVISENSLSICAILESHGSDSNLQRLCSLVFRHWDWTSNGIFCSK
ncbi:hypothetical protein Tco_1444546, partial [Tanacetum coccineum]